jgi:hypothetical protein
MCETSVVNTQDTRGLILVRASSPTSSREPFHVRMLERVYHRGRRARGSMDLGFDCWVHDSTGRSPSKGSLARPYNSGGQRAYKNWGFTASLISKEALGLVVLIFEPLRASLLPVWSWLTRWKPASGSFCRLQRQDLCPRSGVSVAGTCREVWGFPRAVSRASLVEQGSRVMDTQIGLGSRLVPEPAFLSRSLRVMVARVAPKPLADFRGLIMSWWY